jgi:hypothetical protein
VLRLPPDSGAPATRVVSMGDWSSWGCEPAQWHTGGKRCGGGVESGRNGTRGVASWRVPGGCRKLPGGCRVGADSSESSGPGRAGAGSERPWEGCGGGQLRSSAETRETPAGFPRRNNRGSVAEMSGGFPAGSARMCGEGSGESTGETAGIYAECAGKFGCGAGRVARGNGVRIPGRAAGGGADGPEPAAAGPVDSGIHVYTFHI